MTTHLKTRLEKIDNVLSKLGEQVENGKPMIVEGKKDANALLELGVGGKVFTVKTGGKSFLQAAAEIESLGVEEVILLLDFDRRGREGTKRLQQSLERTNTKVNVRFWRELSALISHDVQCIESLPAYLATVQQKAEDDLPFLCNGGAYKRSSFCQQISNFAML
ncbi:MAG: toprim domain-containing protein [Nitrososphaerota archaeon]|jgi:5S rRNA maturation endonuclease (ribonuclease M5)|nr:toprim domain-containing protein [Nitrososphaerota archaeon]